MHRRRMLHSVIRLVIFAVLGLGTLGCESIGGMDDNNGAATSGGGSDQVISRPPPSADDRRTTQTRGTGGTARTTGSRRGDQPSANEGGRWYSMSADAFLDSREARRKIDLDHIDSDVLGAAVFHETNRLRAEHGLAALRHLDGLDEAAMMQARSMARGKYLAHTNRDDSSLREPMDRVRAAGLKPRFVAENIATAFGIRYQAGTNVYVIEDESDTKRFSYEPGGKPIPNHTYRTFARDLVKGWMNSPGHRQNILHQTPTHMGNACAPSVSDAGMPMFYCAQVFYTGQ